MFHLCEAGMVAEAKVLLSFDWLLARARVAAKAVLADGVMVKRAVGKEGPGSRVGGVDAAECAGRSGEADGHIWLDSWWAG